MALRAAHALATQVVEAQAKAPRRWGCGHCHPVWREHSGEAGERLAFVRGGGTPSLFEGLQRPDRGEDVGGFGLVAMVVTPTCCMVSVDAAAVGGEEGM